MTIRRTPKCLGKIQYILLHVEIHILWLLMKKANFIAGDKPGLDKLETAKRQNKSYQK
jgi:hypothetical protein